MTRVRILQVLGGLNRGGAETMVMNLYRNIDRDKIQFDFVTHLDEKGDYEDEIEKMGGKIFRVPRYKIVNHIAYINAWKKLLRNHPEWKIVHGHMYTLASIYLKIAKNESRITIAHSHSTSNGKGFKAYIQDIIEKPLPFIADRFMACSDDAGLWLFGEDIIKSDKYLMLPNAIDVEKFKYNEATRLKVRKYLNIEDKIVLGHIGRYDYQKNFPFLIELIDRISKIDQRYVLLQIGNGKYNNELTKIIKEKNLENSIILLGTRDDVPKLMQAMDLFVFPSHNEGLGMVAIEAQTSGLPCILSDTIPKEVKLTNLVKFLPINNDDSLNIWTNEVLELSNFIRTDTSDRIKKSGYDINDTSDFLLKFYRGLHV